MPLLHSVNVRSMVFKGRGVVVFVPGIMYEKVMFSQENEVAIVEESNQRF